MAMILRDILQEPLDSAYCNERFQKARKKLESVGYHVASCSEIAFLRVQQGHRHNVSIEDALTRESVLVYPGKGIFVSKVSSAMENPNLTKIDSIKPSEEILSRIMSDCVLVKDKIILTRDIAKHELTQYLFGDFAKDYQEFLKKRRIRGIDLWLGNIEQHDEIEECVLSFGSFNNGRNMPTGNISSTPYPPKGVRGVKTHIDGYIEPHYKEMELCAEILKSVYKGKMPSCRLKEVYRFLETI